MGARLHPAEGTVRVRVRASLGKFGVRNRVEAAIAACGAGLTGRNG
ncbi:response regulator transcription factor [Streptomyces goshikiensis]